MDGFPAGGTAQRKGFGRCKRRFVSAAERGGIRQNRHQEALEAEENNSRMGRREAVWKPASNAPITNPGSAF
jgi:hypothetical protein